MSTLLALFIGLLVVAFFGELVWLFVSDLLRDR